MRRYLPFVIVIAVGLTAVGTGTALYRARRPAIPSTKQASSETEAGDSVHALGPADAPVTLEEFADFQCPPCGKLSEPINQLQREYGSKLRFVFRNFPLGMHQHAREAAMAAEAAGLQGKFWQMHDLLFSEQAVWSKLDDIHSLFDAYAGMIGLNLERFHKDMQSAEVAARISIDQKHGSVIGVRNTPTLFLNNQALSPEVLDPTKLRAVVSEAMKEKQPSS